MSFFGKLLIVFQVLFSFVFMAFAGAVYTAQVNWKAKAEGLQEQVTTANQQASQQATLWQTERSALENQANDLQSKFQTAQADFNNAKNELDGLKQDYDQLKTIEKVFEAESGLSKEEAEARREEAYRQREVNRQQNKTLEDLVIALRDAKDEIFSMSKEMEAMERKHVAALEDLATYKLMARENGWSQDPKEYARAQAPAPLVKGIVIQAKDANDRGTERLVEISLGERDGLVAGHELYIFRPAGLNEGRPMYLGSIRLVTVTPNRAVGTVVEKAKNGTISKDDHVTTQL
jgi:chromosome segregation ATPase